MTSTLACKLHISALYTLIFICSFAFCFSLFFFTDFGTNRNSHRLRFTFLLYIAQYRFQSYELPAHTDKLVKIGFTRSQNVFFHNNETWLHNEIFSLIAPEKYLK